MDEWTPERWAGRALDYFLAANGRVPDADHALFISAVTHMIRQAVEQERERCAKVAEGYQDLIDEARIKAGYANAPNIAALIRALD